MVNLLCWEDRSLCCSSDLPHLAPAHTVMWPYSNPTSLIPPPKPRHAVSIPSARSLSPGTTLFTYCTSEARVYTPVACLLRRIKFIYSDLWYTRKHCSFTMLMVSTEVLSPPVLSETIVSPFLLLLRYLNSSKLTKEHSSLFFKSVVLSVYCLWANGFNYPNLLALSTKMFSSFFSVWFDDRVPLTTPSRSRGFTYRSPLHILYFCFLFSLLFCNFELFDSSVLLVRLIEARSVSVKLEKIM